MRTDAAALIDHFAQLATHPTVYLGIPPRAYPNSFGIDGMVLHDQIEPILREVAASKSVATIDLYTPTANDSSLLSSDMVHPTDAGYTLLATVIHDALRSGAGGGGGSGGGGPAGASGGRAGGSAGASGSAGGSGGSGGTSSGAAGDAGLSVVEGHRVEGQAVWEAVARPQEVAPPPRAVRHARAPTGGPVCLSVPRFVAARGGRHGGAASSPARRGHRAARSGRPLPAASRWACRPWPLTKSLRPARRSLTA